MKTKFLLLVIFTKLALASGILGQTKTTKKPTQMKPVMETPVEI